MTVHTYMYMYKYINALHDLRMLQLELFSHHHITTFTCSIHSVRRARARVHSITRVVDLLKHLKSHWLSGRSPWQLQGHWGQPEACGAPLLTSVCV